jgi:hypothetical protein
MGFDDFGEVNLSPLDFGSKLFFKAPLPRRDPIMTREKAEHLVKDMRTARSRRVASRNLIMWRARSWF